MDKDEATSIFPTSIVLSLSLSRILSCGDGGVSASWIALHTGKSEKQCQQSCSSHGRGGSRCKQDPRGFAQGKSARWFLCLIACFHCVDMRGEVNEPQLPSPLLRLMPSFLSPFRREQHFAARRTAIGKSGGVIMCRLHFTCTVRMLNLTLPQSHTFLPSPGSRGWGCGISFPFISLVLYVAEKRPLYDNISVCLCKPGWRREDR